MRDLGRIRVQALLALAILPLVLLGLAVLILRAYEWLRYEPAYFTATYVDRYSTASAAAQDLEVAIQTGDRTLAAELQGIRRPARFMPSASTSLIMLWERSDRFVTYLYFDEPAYERHLLPFQQVRGRWVAVAPGIYHTLRSGGWQRIFLPAAFAWWILAGAALAAGRFLRGSERFRAWLRRGPAPGRPSRS